jgi:hypothetical protein
MTICAEALASTADGSVSSTAFLGIGEHAVFIFSLSSEIKDRPSCNTTGNYVVHMNGKNAIFVVSLIIGTRNRANWNNTASVSVSGKNVCTAISNAEEVGTISIHDGKTEVGYLRPGITVPENPAYPAPPVIQSLQPAQSPVLEYIVDGFWHDYCSLPMDETFKKWATARSQLSALQNGIVKTPFGGYVDNGSIKLICTAGALFGRSFFDERSRQTYAERIRGRSATVLWRTSNPDYFHGFALYKEGDNWKIDYMYYTFPSPD